MLILILLIVDDSVPEEERQLRRALREKYDGRPRTAAIDQYREPYVSSCIAYLFMYYILFLCKTDLSCLEMFQKIVYISNELYV